MYEDYDPGILNDFGGGNVGWWMDYLRAEIERCNEHWNDQILNSSERSVHTQVRNASGVASDEQNKDMSDYSISLQRAIEYYCRGKIVPDDILKICPHHATMLNNKLKRV
uniref:Uncharacterized protein n=1 Tax=viral metagenome TaxID=1070528 RepID=A0A6M3KV51_9ZZZZ